VQTMSIQLDLVNMSEHVCHFDSDQLSNTLTVDSVHWQTGNSN